MVTFGSGSLSLNVLAATYASFVTKRASRIAFRRYGRAMTSPDVIQSLGSALTETFEKEDSMRG